jgi:phosphatidylinositol glycan class W
MVVLKVIGYHEHVTEYGVHWNFFVTLFSVWTIVDLLHSTTWLCRRRHLPWLAIAILVVYQTALVMTPLTDFMFAAPRSNFIYANREGILSLAGYVPLYLLAESRGQPSPRLAGRSGRGGVSCGRSRPVNVTNEWGGQGTKW